MKKILPFLGMIQIAACCAADFDARQEMIKWMQKAGMQRWLRAPVTISQTPSGVLTLRDQGVFAVQYALLEPAVAAEPNIDPRLHPQSAEP